MPGKEAVVEVEKNGVVPEPVTKEIPKCDEVSASIEVKGKKDEEPQSEKAVETAPVTEPAVSKPQDSAISSSVEHKAEDSNKKTEAESTNGGAAKPQEKTVEPQAEEVPANGESSDKVAEVVEKSSEATPKAAPVDETKSSAVDVEPVPEKMETTEGDKSSEAAAKPLSADDEKIVVEKDAEPKCTPDVTGSDEAKKPEASLEEPSALKESCNPSADSSSEKKLEAPKPTAEEKPGSSSTAVVEPDIETQIAELKKTGVAFYVGKDYCAAADTFGKILEVAAPLYGEMSEKLAETYYMYGTSMFEYGKDQNDVLGEKVKEKDDDEDEEDDDEQMEVDDKESAENGPSSATKDSKDSGKVDETVAVDGKDSVKADDTTGDEKGSEKTDETVAGDEKDTGKADETITGDEKEDDEDDAFRVAWEMLELAKATFQKADNKKRLADTLMKLGDVGIETGDAEAIAEMVEGLKVRKELYPANHRIIPETHFKIGVAFAYFEKYDDAIQHFTDAQQCLEKRIVELSSSVTKEDKDEVEEMKSILPEIQEKIQDTKESKLDKEKIKSSMAESSSDAPATFPAPSEDSKPAANISHLVKRKRKVDEILPERAAKLSRPEGAEIVASSTAEEPKTEESAKPAAMETSGEQEKAAVEEPKPAEVDKSKDTDKPDEKPKEVENVEPPKADQTEKAAEETAEPAKPKEQAKSDDTEKMEE